MHAERHRGNPVRAYLSDWQGLHGDTPRGYMRYPMDRRALELEFDFEDRLIWVEVDKPGTARNGALTQVPAQIDLSGFDKHSQVRSADATEWGLPQSLPGMEDLRLYRIVDMRVSLPASLAVVPHADPDTVKAVLRACSDHQVAVPVQVWEAGKLPAWLRRAAGD